LKNALSGVRWTPRRVARNIAAAVAAPASRELRKTGLVARRHCRAADGWMPARKKTPAEAGVLFCSGSAEDQKVIVQLLM
jgi:hypothetical protein